MTSFIPGLGEEASEFLKNGYDYTQSRVSDIAKDSLTESFSNNLAIAMARNATDAEHQGQIVQAGLLYNMAERSILCRRSFSLTALASGCSPIARIYDSLSGEL